MSVVNVRLNIGSFNIKINVDKDIKVGDNDIIRKYEYAKRIDEVTEKIKDIRAAYSFFNHLY